MNTLPSARNNTVIAVASITGDLHQVNQIAWNVSITAKNAMIISAQAGEVARGFQPITRYIDEIARTTIDNTRKVENEAVHLTRLAARYLRSLDAYTRFQKVRHYGDNARYLYTFLPVAERCVSQLRAETIQLHRQLQLLNDVMHDLELNMDAALAIASVCRIEASRAGAYRASLSVVADSLESAARTIKQMVKDGIDRVETVTLAEIE